ncbi:hypothetical protein [Crenobacter cavernae]|uniref:hypothetical protein n=1 Tax=Crenobacter cavernae TaxID=2290923 RepID=UPI001F0C2C93|nr:hypothetical protein [Crenobacter cavernae]
MKTLSLKCSLVLVLALGLVQAALAIEVITLNWRDANEVADALAPHLRAGESASALDNRLILDVSPARAAQLRRIVSSLDVRPVSLLVEVEQQSRRRGGSATIDWGGKISGSDVEIGTGDGVDLRAKGRDSRADSRQTLRLLDNHSGYIALSDSRPLPWQVIGPRGPIGGIDYREAIRGFHVRPRLAGGDRVLVDIATRDDAFRGRTLDASRLATTVEGRLGDWIVLGGVGQDNRGREVVLFGAGASRANVARQVRLRITRLP